MFRLLANCSLFQQIAIPMFVVAFIGMSATFYSAENLKNSIDDSKRFYEASNYHVNKLHDIEKNFSSFRTLALKHLTSEKASQMAIFRDMLIHDKKQLEDDIKSFSNLLLAEKESAILLSNIHLLIKLTEQYFKSIDEAVQQSGEFEKETAFEIWSEAEQRYVSIINNSIQNFIKEEFKKLISGRDAIILATNNNLMLTITFGISGGILLLIIAFYIARRFAIRLRKLLVWSENISNDAATFVPLVDNTNDEVGKLTRSMNLMSKNITQSYTDLKIAKTTAEEANRSKSEFLANMSHELRTPMHAMLSFSALGERNINDVSLDKLKHYFSIINISGKRLLVLLNDLLDLSKLEAGCMEFHINKHDFAMIVDAAVTEFEELVDKKMLILTIDGSESETLCSFDSEKLLQVIRNLLSNAIRYTPERKHIALSYCISQPKVTDNQLDDESKLIFSISDQGVGIPENELEIVFDKFVQSSKTRTDSGGTGLGLAICKEIIEGHGGTITASNNPEGGAVFSFTIPQIQYTSIQSA